MRLVGCILFGFFCAPFAIIGYLIGVAWIGVKAGYLAAILTFEL